LIRSSQVDRRAPSILRDSHFSQKTREMGHPAISAVLILFLLASLVSAQTLTGTVKNATTGKPAAGDDVVLLKLGQGMEEAGRTKADA